MNSTYIICTISMVALMALYQTVHTFQLKGTPQEQRHLMTKKGHRESFIWFVGAQEETDGYGMLRGRLVPG